PASRLRRFLVAAGVAGAVFVLTRWIVLAAAGGVLVLVWPALFGGARQERVAAAKIEALATWAESLRDTIAGAVGLEQAIPATVYAAAPVIREDLALLADRMRVRVPLATALRQFADDLDDPTADLIVSALMMNSRLRGPGLRQLLGALADTARAELDMRQRVSASRAGTRRSAQIVVVFSVLVMLGLALFNRSFVAPYSTVQGQLVLLIVVGLFAIGLMWMRRLSGVVLPRRFLTVSAVGVEPAKEAA
ncbi:type II secretion system F family protein, partial [Actinomyces sp. MRS3W]|uniref:type II secretion system F family protein n=1 Tax=Actinomyces sp. MRS3W TaxID=2800796 RepID=UPI0028FD1D6B